MKELGDDGVYLDGTSQVMPCSNTEHGCGYVGADGKAHPTYPVFANHEFIKRIYTVVKTNRPDGMVDLHYWMPNPAQAAFGDITFTGEQWFQLKKPARNMPPTRCRSTVFAACSWAARWALRWI